MVAPALILMAQAATACPAVSTTRLRAGASVVQAIVRTAPEAFEPERPTPAAVSDRAGETVVDKPEPDQRAEKCKALPLPIA
jgi:hypothetical protein